MSKSTEIVVALREERPDATLEELMDFFSNEYLNNINAGDERHKVWINAVEILTRMQNRKSPLIIRTVIDQVAGEYMRAEFSRTELTNRESIIKMVDLLILKTFDQNAISDACEKADCNKNEVTWVIQNKRDLLEEMCELEAQYQTGVLSDKRVLEA